MMMIKSGSRRIATWNASRRLAPCFSTSIATTFLDWSISLSVASDGLSGLAYARLHALECPAIRQMKHCVGWSILPLRSRCLHHCSAVPYDVFDAVRLQLDQRSL